MLKIHQSVINYATNCAYTYKSKPMCIGDLIAEYNHYTQKTYIFIVGNNLVDDYNENDIKIGFRCWQEYNAINIEIDKNIFDNESITENFIFYSIIWCAELVKNKEPNFFETDMKVLKWYVENYQEHKLEILNGWVSIFLNHPTQENKNRFKEMLHFVSNKN